MNWDAAAERKCTDMAERIPVFHRLITGETVTRLAQERISSRGGERVKEVDSVAAFFQRCARAVLRVMIRLLEQAGLDYRACGYRRTCRRTE